jgi:hypothetical protein
LLRHAALHDLQKPNVLLAQVHRMLKDERARGMATEFGGNWLDFRSFETHNAVDRMRFPNFDNQLREAMFQEPIHFIENLIQDDRSVLDLLYADYTFVNPVLAKFYGVPEVKGDADTWVRVDDASRYQRGGLLPMAVFLTKSSPGLRTSPVKRGYWVVHRVLGETIPPPPPVVPELPADEAKSNLSMREMLNTGRTRCALPAMRVSMSLVCRSKGTDRWVRHEPKTSLDGPLTPAQFFRGASRLLDSKACKPTSVTTGRRTSWIVSAANC